MSYRFVTGALALSILTAACSVAGDGLKSGPQVGKPIPGVFHPTNVTGPFADKKQCLI
jgi:hypothetical protein